MNERPDSLILGFDLAGTFVFALDICATAVLAGSAVMIALQRLGLRPSLAAAAGGIFCFLLRLVAVCQHWNLPTAGVP
jgi:uncharacterized membrane protein YeiH